MNNAKKELCRFCLKIIRDENFHIKENITSEILDVLFIEMDLGIDEKSLICSDCQDDIKRCLNFKSVCLSSENSIAKYIREGSKLDLEDVYLKKKFRRKSECIPRGHKICRLCMKISATAKCFNNTDELIALTNDVLHKFIPEVDLDVVKNPVICKACLLSLQSYSAFVTGCLDVEKKINRYCEATGVAKRQVQLYNVLQFVMNEVLECDVREYAVLRGRGKLDNDKSNIENNGKELNTTEFGIKTEETMLKSEDDYDSCSSKSINYNSEMELFNRGQVNFLGAEQCDLHEDMNCDGHINDVDTEEKQEALSSPSMVKVENTDKGHKESFVERSVTEHAIKNEEIEIKSEDLDVRDNNGKKVSENIKKNMHCCQFCTFTTRGSKVFDRHLLIHKTSAEEIVYKCDDCSFISKFKIGLKLHTMKIHGYPSKHQELKCKLCPYKSIYLSSMNVHELTHLPPSERPKFKCSMCDFQSLNKGYFKEHLKIHDVNSESAWYRCTTCSFKAVHRCQYRIHMRNHKFIPEAELFHCAHCPYKAKLKKVLRYHLVKHRNKSEIITFNCDKCPYKAKHKSTLNVHMRTHKSLHENKFYKCETCDYVTLRRVYLKLHNLQHKDKSEVQMYRCDECTFETKYKHGIKAHKEIVHGDAFQIKMYKCEVCPYQCKRRRSLKEHSLSHKSIEEVPIVYKCLHCSYQSKYKSNLAEHVQTHMDESRRLMFKCKVCGHKFKTKKSVKRHNGTCIRPSRMGVKRKGDKQKLPNLV